MQDTEKQKQREHAGAEQNGSAGSDANSGGGEKTMMENSRNGEQSKAKKIMLMPICESLFNYHEHECAVLLQPMGHRCGYVGLKKNSKYYGKLYDEIPIDCHGGLTYASDHLECIGKPNDGEFARTVLPELWWIGFDCAHYGDVKDYPSVYIKYADFKNWIKIISEIESIEKKYRIACVVRTLEFCEAECRSIVDQLINLEALKAN